MSLVAPLALLGPAWGGSPEAASDGVDGPRIAANASLEVVAAPAPGEPASPTVGALPDAGHESAAGATVGADVSGMRRSRLRSGAARSASPSADAKTPWFRTAPGALAIVLTLIVGGAWALRRWWPAAAAADAGLLRIVARLSLSPKQTLALVHVGRRFVLVGASGDGLASLAEIRDPEEVAELLTRCTMVGQRGRPDFDSLLAEEAGTNERLPLLKLGSLAPAATLAAAVPKSIGKLLHRLRELQHAP